MKRNHSQKGGGQRGQSTEKWGKILPEIAYPPVT